MTRPSATTIRLIAAILVLFSLVGAACGGDDDGAQVDPTPTAEPDPDPTSTPEPDPDPTATTAPEPDPTAAPDPDPTATEEPTATPVPEKRIVNVYWVRDTQIAVGGRSVEMPGLARGALDAMLAGPNQLETDLGMVSAIPAGTEILGLTIADGVATVDISSDLEATGLGTSGEIALVSQIVFTLTQFPSVDSVDILIDGQAREAILSHGLEATNLTREGFLDAIAPAIVVESPYPGQEVTSPLTVTGFSRTFEATVVYVVTIPPSDEIVDEGFTTAAQPDAPFFGPFEFTVEFDPDVAGFGSVIVFEESAQDGSQINIYEVPVMMAP